MAQQGDVTVSSRQQALDIWHVRLASGETRTLSLDELDAAFHDGWINGRTMVLPAGALRWAPLSEVAGLEDETPEPVEAMPNSIAPLALDTSELDSESDLEARAFRPRRGRRVLGVLGVVLVLAGVGFGGNRARPVIARALASQRGGPVAAAKVEAPKPVVTPAPITPVVATPVVATPAPPTAAIPTMLASALPDVPAKGKPARPAPASKRAAK